MAYEALKTLIRQYIKPNEQEEITGAILQGILLEMVNQLGVAGNYLPLTGGNITGNVIVSSNPTATTHNAVRLAQSGVTIENIASVGLNEVLGLSANSITYQSYFPNATPSTMAVSFGMTGITLTGGITASSFVNSSVEQSVRGNYLLKADGNVVSISDIGGGVDMAVVWESLADDTNEQIASSHLTTALSTYATITQLGNYLPLAGGTITGNLQVNGSTTFAGGTLIIENVDTDTFITHLGNSGVMHFEGAETYQFDAEMYVDAQLYATSFIKVGGTSSQFLKADGSVDSNTYITSASLSDYATQSWVNTQLAGYLPLTGGTITGNLTVNGSTTLAGGTLIIENVDTGTFLTHLGNSGNMYFDGAEVYQFDAEMYVGAPIYATSFIKIGGTSAQFLKADGSVDSNTYLPKQGNSFYFITDADMPETAANISTLNAAHRMTLYRNAILMPYQMNDANDGGFIRSRGTSESSAIMEIGMWDDAGAGETIQFNYYPTTSTINPTYSISVPKKTGTIALTSDLASYLPLTGGTITGNLQVNGSTTFAGGTLIIENVDTDTFITHLGNSGVMHFEGAETYQFDAETYVDAQLYATSFIKVGGTSAQFLKADGSVDSNTYVTSSALSGYLPLTGGTMTGGISWNGSTSLPERTTIDYFVVIDAFADGGRMKWSSVGNLKTSQLTNDAGFVTSSVLANYNPTNNFKTINGNSIIGTGNINIQGGGTLYDAEVEYLETTGAQIIDCDINPSGASTVSFNGMASYSQSNGRMFMAGDGNEHLSHYCEFSDNKFGAYQFYINVQLSSNTMFNVSMTINGTTSTNYGIVVGGNSYNVTATNYQGPIYNKFYLFGINPNLKSTSGLRIGKCKLYINNTVVRDFIPVRVGQVGYLYDKVSGQLFGNSGTGDFVLGQDTGPGGGLPYLPLTGGNITGNLTVNGSSVITTANIGSQSVYYATYAGSANILGHTVTENTSHSLSNGDTLVYDSMGTWLNVPSGLSDIRKKDVINYNAEPTFEAVANAPAIRFTYKDARYSFYQGVKVGSVAQYWKTKLPEAVNEDKEGYLSMQYDVLGLLAAIAVAKRVANHEERIILLERENEALKKEIADLKSA